MKSLQNYINESYIDAEGQIKFSDAEIASLNAEQDLHVCSLLQALTSNWYHYANVHSKGENQQKFNAHIISSYKKTLESCFNGNSAAESDYIKSVAKDLYDDMKKVKSSDFDRTMEIIFSYVPRIKDVTIKAKKAYKDASNALQQELDVAKETNKD